LTYRTKSIPQLASPIFLLSGSDDFQKCQRFSSKEPLSSNLHPELKKDQYNVSFNQSVPADPTSNSFSTSTWDSGVTFTM
jgi:hypothetical protein